MHWGSHDNEGSEHVIDGIRLPAEVRQKSICFLSNILCLQLHIVTWNISQYKTPQEAVMSERFGGLMVFAILIKVKDKKKLVFYRF